MNLNQVLNVVDMGRNNGNEQQLEVEGGEGSTKMSLVLVLFETRD